MTTWWSRIAALADRELFWVADHRDGLAALLLALPGAIDVAGELRHGLLADSRVAQPGRPVGMTAQPMGVSQHQLRQHPPQLGQR